MARPIVVLPDAPLAVIQYLRQRTEVTTLVPAARITTAIPPKNVQYPLILVQRAGGQPLVKEFIDEAAIQISVLGGSQYDCSQVMRTVSAAMVAIANDKVDAGVLVSGFVEVGSQWIPDTTTVPPLSRFIARFAVLLHP
jgi:hypothetical protein